MLNFKLRGIYSFDVYPSALLGTTFSNVTVVGILDSESAAKEIPIQELHVQVYPTLPVGTPNNPSGYDYLKIKTTTGETTILGMAWINEQSVQEVLLSTITAVIGGVSAIDLPRIRNCLIQNGYNNIQLDIK
jgi:hypothetical protein